MWRLLNPLTISSDNRALLANNSCRVSAVPDLLWANSNVDIALRMSVKYVCQIFVCLDTSAISLPLNTHLWASHTLRANTSLVELMLKYVFSSSTISALSPGSWTKPGLNHHILDLGTLLASAKDIRIGWWPEISILSINAWSISGISTWEIKM